MTRQSMARVSSASTEPDFAPAIQTPFDWEATPGRATARKSTRAKFYGNLKPDADEMPSLPLPPGRRPKDGFYLPFSREFGEFGESPEVQLEAGGNSSKPRKFFNLKFPGSYKKPSRMHLPFQSSPKPTKASQEEEDPGFRACTPLSGQRFGSSITSRMLMQFQKKQSLWRRCLPSKPERMNGSPSFIYPNRGRRLDEGFEDGFGTPVSGPLFPSSPGHGHPPSCNSSPDLKSSRFMAAMLISLCPDDVGDFQVEAEDGNSDDYNDEIGIPHLTSPRTKNSSPEAFEVEVDPASQIVTSQEQWTCTCRHRANMERSTASQGGKTSRSVSRSLSDELTAASRLLSQYSRGGKIEQPRSRGTEDSANKMNENDQEDSADAYPMSFKPSLNRKLLRRRETSISPLTWKPSSAKNRQSIADSGAGREISDSEYADEPIFDDDGEEYERRERDTPIFSSGSNNSSSPEFSSLRKTVWPGPHPLINKHVDVPVPKSKSREPRSMVGYLSPPRISIDDLEYTYDSDKPKAFARWRSIPEPSALRSRSVDRGGSERKQAPVNLNSFSGPLQKQAFQRNTTPSKIRTRDLVQTAKSSSLRPSPANALQYREESDEDSDCSTDLDSSGYQTPAVSSPHALPNFASPKPASPKLLNPPSHRRHGSVIVEEESILPGPSFQQIMMARSHSVRSTSSRRFGLHEYQGDTNVRGPSRPSRLAKTSSSSVMSKVALFESKAGVSKSGPLTYTSSQ